MSIDAPDALQLAAAALEAGELVAIPTDTVYGIAAVAGNPAALQAIFALKSRPDAVALPVLVGELEQALALIEANSTFERLAAAFWPGPLTIVAKRVSGVAFELGGDPATIGIRAPDSAFVRELCRRVGPLAVTSANLHGTTPCTSVAEVCASFGADALLCVDGGVCSGEVSTVASVIEGRLAVLREGAISTAALHLAIAPGLE